MSYRARTMNVKTRAALSSVSVAVVLATTGLAGCSADPSGAADRSPADAVSESAAPAEDDVLVIQPGAPGEPTATGSTLAPPEPAAWNHDDVAFVQMMVPHHSQAVAMSQLARTRAQDPQVRALAERIGASQLPEIQLMSSWLEEQQVDVPSPEEDPMSYDHGDHGHDGMEGMLTPQELDALAAARGREFDRLFLEGMIRHHEGAVTMADDVTVGGTALQVNELAADVASGQAAEIGRMRDLLRSL